MEKSYDIKQLATTKRNEITIYAHSKEGKHKWENMNGKNAEVYSTTFFSLYVKNFLKLSAVRGKWA